MISKLQALKKWLEGRGYPIEKMFLTKHDWCLIMTKKPFNDEVIRTCHVYFYLSVMRCATEGYWKHNFHQENSSGHIIEVIE
jgi:hypothetical protein